MATSLQDIVKEKISAIILKWGQGEVELMKKILVQKGKIASKFLYNSLKAEMKDDLQLIIHMAEYGDDINDGRKPGKFPPLAPLKKWLQIKGLPEAALFPIAKKIKEKGTKPTNFTEPFTTDIAALQKKLLEGIGPELLAFFKKELEAAKVFETKTIQL